MYSRRIHHDMLMAINNMYVCMCVRIFSLSCFAIIPFRHLLSILLFEHFHTHTHTHTLLCSFLSCTNKSNSGLISNSMHHRWFLSFVQGPYLRAEYVFVHFLTRSHTISVPPSVAGVNMLRIDVIARLSCVRFAFAKQYTLVTAVRWINFDSIFISYSKTIWMVICLNGILLPDNHTKQNAFYNFTIL